MMITLNARDFNQLSESCQKEVLALLAFNDGDASSGKDHARLAGEDLEMNFDGVMDRREPAVENPANSGESVHRVIQLPAKKELVDISIEQARQLIANVGELSKKTLRLLASRQSVPLEVLIGPNADYADYQLLKKSLVGAVNRRLRTVTGNRAAVLLVGDQSKSYIGLRPLSAAALRQALDVLEPIPLIEYFDREGFQLDTELPEALAFFAFVQAAWRDFTLRPPIGFAHVSALQIAEHLVTHGFKLTYGRYVVAENGGQIGRFEYLPEVDAREFIHVNDGFSNCADDAAVNSRRTFLTHVAVPGVLGLVG